MHKLLVKGNRYQAARAAADRGIPFVFVSEANDVVAGNVGSQHDAAVVAWFHEQGQAPFPVGTLLSFHRTAEES